MIQISRDYSTIGQEGISCVSDSASALSYGKKSQVIINRYERDPAFRRQCVDYHGYEYQICGFFFEKKFSELGREFCHVHHIEPVSETDGKRIVDPTKKMLPVCPNCHAMLHRKTPALKPHELKAVLNKKQ